MPLANPVKWHYKFEFLGGKCDFCEMAALFYLSAKINPDNSEESEVTGNKSCIYPNKSEWVPVSVRMSISSVSRCSQMSNQSGWIWHSQKPFHSPDNLWGLYRCGSLPSFANKVTTSSKQALVTATFQAFLIGTLELIGEKNIVHHSSNFAIKSATLLALVTFP